MITEKIFKKIIQTQFALIITTFVLVVFETEIYPLVDEDLSFTFQTALPLCGLSDTLYQYVCSINLSHLVRSYM